jgi:pantoate--beta-alanine ligase|eukprot:31018-Pelagococcus_subviridis.AAC.31
MGAVMNNANAAKEGRGLEATLMAGGALASSLQTIVRDAIAMSGGEVDYVEVVDQLTLRPVERVTAGDKVVVLVAAKYGDVRLLDNVEIGGEA